jgi:hypothetical protein
MLLFHGPETVETGAENVVGCDCGDDDNFRDSIFPTIYFGLIGVLNVIATFSAPVSTVSGPWNNSIGHDSTTPIETEPIRLLLALPEEKLLNGLHILYPIKDPREQL